MANGYKIYSGDYAKDGYDQGIEDSKQHKGKNKFKFFKAIHPINYVWNFNNAYDSFAKNYDQGYLDGQRVNHQIYSTTPNQGGLVMSNTYEHHLQLLNEAQENIVSLIRVLHDMQERYQRQIVSAQSAGFMQNYTEQLQQKHQRFSVKVDELVSMIQRHKATMDKHKEAIEELIYRADD